MAHDLMSVVIVKSVLVMNTEVERELLREKKVRRLLFIDQASRQA